MEMRNFLKLKKPFEVFISPYIQTNGKAYRLNHDNYFYSMVHLLPFQKLEHKLSIPLSNFIEDTRKNFLLNYDITQIDDKKRRIYTTLSAISPLYTMLNYKFLFNITVKVKRQDLYMELKVILNKRTQRKCSRVIKTQIRKYIQDYCSKSPDFESPQKILQGLILDFNLKDIMKDHPHSEFIRSILLIKVRK